MHMMYMSIQLISNYAVTDAADDNDADANEINDEIAAADATTPSSKSRSYTRRSVPLSLGGSFLI